MKSKSWRIWFLATVLTTACILWSLNVSTSARSPKEMDVKWSEILDILSNSTDFDVKTLPVQNKFSVGSKGVIFSSFLLLVILGYGLYYSSNHRFWKSSTNKAGFNVPEPISREVKGIMGQSAESWNSFESLRLPAIGSGSTLQIISSLIPGWLILGTIGISLTAAWPPGQTFFFIVNAGLGRGFSIATPFGADSWIGQLLTILNELCGAVLFGSALAFLLDSLLERVRGDATNAIIVRCSENTTIGPIFAKIPTNGKNRTVAVSIHQDSDMDSIGVDTTGDGYVDTLLARRPPVFLTPDRVYFTVALVFWIALGAVYGGVCEGMDTGMAIYFSATTLGMGGITNLRFGPDGFLPELHAWILGLWICIGVPLFACTMASLGSFVLEQGVRERERRAISDPIPEEDFEIASRIVQPDDSLDRTEFVLLELLRMGRADIATIAAIYQKFEEIDVSKDGRVDKSEILKYNDMCRKPAARRGLSCASAEATSGS